MIAQVIKEILLDQNKLIDLAQESFKEADEDNSGEIDIYELKNVLLKFTSMFTKDPLTEEDIEDIIANYDVHEKGCLDFNEYFLLIKDILYAILEVNVNSNSSLAKE